jgi:hypothetical protein
MTLPPLSSLDDAHGTAALDEKNRNLLRFPANVAV